MAMSCWMNPIQDWNSVKGYSGASALRVFRKQSDIVRPSPSECWVMIDENPISINDGWFVSDPNTPSTWWDMPASYHNGAGGLSYADGHSEIRKWKDTSVLSVTTLAGGVAKNPASSDLNWLHNRTTVRD
jgi:prepilin-type processing-associated H-X9-DG protein